MKTERERETHRIYLDRKERGRKEWPVIEQGVRKIYETLRCNILGATVVLILSIVPVNKGAKTFSQETQKSIYQTFQDVKLQGSSP